jgi:UDP-N-acetylglucosamine/UDP-N-acetylgalactosamine diphosphorylase
MRTERKFQGWYFFVLMILMVGSLKAAEDIRAKLTQIGQEQLLQHWDALSAVEKKNLSQQIEALDIATFNDQRKQMKESDSLPGQGISPFLNYQKSGSLQDIDIGRKAIAAGQVGCLIVAGGQGTRLNYTGPKGLFPVTVIKNKSLFQLVSERVLAAGVQANRPLFMAIMTSPTNHDETVKHFEQNRYFGLNPKQVFFFSQEELPLLDQKGDLFLETPSKISTGPDGNAASLKHFVDKGVWSKWYQQGVRYLVYLHIDNPLADPFDAELIGFHKRQQSDLVIKCIARQDPKEKLGVIVIKNGKPDVIEYSEIIAEERDARDPDGALKHPCGNVSMFSFKMDFVRDVANRYYDQLPFHKAWKAVKYLTPEGETKTADKPMAWKFEKFIFDILPYASSVNTLMYPREVCFAPLKNATGPDGIDDVKKAIQNYDRIVFAKITGNTSSSSTTFELSPQFYYPTQTLISKWKGKQLPETGYIEP